jgi:hypothetical protein
MSSPTPPDFASIPVVRLRIDRSVWRLLVAALVGAGAALAVVAWRAEKARSPEDLRRQLARAQDDSNALVRELLRMPTIDSRDAKRMLLRTLVRMSADNSPAANLVYGPDIQDLQEAMEQLDAGERSEQEFRRWDGLAQQGLDQWRRAERTGGGTTALQWTAAQISAPANSGSARERMQRHRGYARRALTRLIDRHWHPVAPFNAAEYPGWPAPRAGDITRAVPPQPGASMPRANLP